MELRNKGNTVMQTLECEITLQWLKEMKSMQPCPNKIWRLSSLRFYYLRWYSCCLSFKSAAAIQLEKCHSSPVKTACSTLTAIKIASIIEHCCLWFLALSKCPENLTIRLFDKWADLGHNSSKYLLFFFNFGNLPKLNKGSDPRRAINNRAARMLVEEPSLASESSRAPVCAIVKGILMINDREVIISLNSIANLLILISTVMPDRHLKIFVTV